MVRDKGKIPKKRFGVKYTRQPAPDHYLNTYLRAQVEEKTWKRIEGMPTNTPHSSSAIKGSNDKSKHAIHFSLDLKLKCKVNASNVHGIW